MNILWHIHGYPPLHNAGAEWMAHEINIRLLKKGHSVKVNCISNGLQDYTFEGIEVHGGGDTPKALELWKEADVIITHLDASTEAFNNAKLLMKEVIEMVHNSIPYLHVRQRFDKTTVIYNSQFTYDDLYEKWYKQHPYTIMTPIINQERFKNVRPDKQGFITLINHFEPKGGKVFHEIARQMPDHKFLCVEGGYGPQYKDETVTNMTYWPNQPDVREVYKKTKIICMPSDYESFGRVAIEAMCCGIPVVVAPTGGLVESVATGGMFANIKNIPSWVSAIKETEANWKRQQLAARAQAEKIKVKQNNEFITFERILQRIDQLK